MGDFALHAVTDSEPEMEEVSTAVAPTRPKPKTLRRSTTSPSIGLAANPLRPRSPATPPLSPMLRRSTTTALRDLRAAVSDTLNQPSGDGTPMNMLYSKRETLALLKRQSLQASHEAEAAEAEIARLEARITELDDEVKLADSAKSSASFDCDVRRTTAKRKRTALSIAEGERDQTRAQAKAAQTLCESHGGTAEAVRARAEAQEAHEVARLAANELAAAQQVSEEATKADKVARGNMARLKRCAPVLPATMHMRMPPQRS